jgi:hypothetical protein
VLKIFSLPLAGKKTATHVAPRCWRGTSQRQNKPDCLIAYGRSGYRAQYYISEDDGRHFNALLVKTLNNAIRRIFERSPGPPGWVEIYRSFGGPWSKVWIHEDTEAFQNAHDGEFLPRRWAPLASKSVWIRAPLPKFPALDVKGTWLSLGDQAYRQDPYKADRDHRLWLAAHA